MRAQAALLVTALFALAMAWAVSGSRLLPIYDGITLPSGPYHYVRPPQGFVGNVSPKPVGALVHVTPGKPFPLSIVYTPERVPQARVDLLDGAFKVPAGATEVNITIKPVLPPSPLASNVEAASNVYAFAARTNTGAALEAVKGKASVDLLAARRHGTPFIEQYRNGQWIALATGQFVSVNIYSAPVATLGDFVLVTPAPPGTSSSGSDGVRTVLIVVASALIVLAAVILLIRLRRQRLTES